MKITQTRKSRRSTFAWLGLTLILTAFASQTLRAAAPPNDDFAKATTITGTDVATVGSNVGATTETGEPSTFSSNYTVWWTWTAPEDGYVTVDTFGTNFDTVVAVYQGSIISDLNYVVVATDNLGTNLTQVKFPAKKGQIFKIQVGTYGETTQGAIRLNLIEGTLASGGITNAVVFGAPTPFNDDFANSSTLSGTNFTAVGFNASATTEANEPLPYHGEGSNTLWWTWTAPENGYVVINTGGTNFANVLAVYQGSFLTELNIVDYDNQSLGTNLSEVEFPVKQGQVFHIQAALYEGNSTNTAVMDTVILNLKETSLASVGITNPTIYGAPTPFNTLFADRALLTGTSLTAIGFNDSATTEQNEPDNDYNILWWTWTAPASGTVTINTIGTDFNNVLAVYQGTYLTELTSLMSANDNVATNQSEVSVRVVAGQTYLIQAGSFDQNEGGTVILNLNLPPATGPKVQTISFPAISAKTFSTASQKFGLDARASSGLPISYSITTYPISISGTNVSLIDTVTIEATQAGNSTYAPAAPVTQTIQLK